MLTATIPAERVGSASYFAANMVHMVATGAPMQTTLVMSSTPRTPQSHISPMVRSGATRSRRASMRYSLPFRSTVRQLSPAR